MWNRAKRRNYVFTLSAIFMKKCPSTTVKTFVLGAILLCFVLLVAITLRKMNTTDQLPMYGQAVETMMRSVRHKFESSKKTVLYIHRTPACFPQVGKTVYANKVWQVARDDLGSAIYVFGAYWDDRRIVAKEYGSFAVIRVFTVSAYPIDADVYCQVRNQNNSLLEITMANAEDCGRALSFNKTLYQERMLSCPVHSDSRNASWISLVFEKCSKATNNISLVRGKEVKWNKVELGVCVAVSYGRINPINLAEWIEYHNLLGVQDFHFYVSQLHSTSMGALQVYSDKGLVHIHQSAPPMECWSKWCQKLAVVPALQDCMYRNMYRFNKLLVIDVDEFLIPRQHSSIPEMLAAFPSITIPRNGSQHYSTSSYMFKNAYFFLDFPTKVKQDKLLQTTKFLTRTPVNRIGYASKSILNPRMCVIVQNHYCLVRTKDLVDSWMYPVSEDQAVIHHYKTCHFSANDCKKLLDNGTIDNSALTFVDRVLVRVQKVLPLFSNL